SRNQDENLDVLISIIKKVSKLRSLDLNIHALDLTDAQYQKLAPYLSNLEELHLNQAEIKDQGLECLLNACPKLKSLSLQWAESLRGRAAHILKEYIKRNPLLESLDVQGSGALAWRARDLQKAFPQLKRVEYISLS
ncbi:MAG: hypothetical protein KDK78_12480, partial [Chlamydiia bacterium]|nr:hypothetical protein [Chlamydiia bacterium]